VRGFAHINPKIYVPMQGPSELGMSADAKLATWDRVADLPRIEVPTLVIGARYDDQETYFAGLTGFLTSLPAARA
jgi:proline iminopeptidase